jgi:hypothetical protein
MNKHNLILGLAVVSLFTACRKTDLPVNEMPEPKPLTEEAKATDSWKSVSNWTSNTAGNSTSFSSRMEDALLTKDVVNQGLVLVYMKKDGKVVSLPFTEEGSKLSWHYQVSDNVLQVNGDAAGTTKVNNEQISYFVISPEKIKSLEAEGTSKIDLMSFTYEKAAAVLK